MDANVFVLSCSYREREFCRVGYYVTHDYGPNVPAPGLSFFFVNVSYLIGQTLDVRFAEPLRDEEGNILQMPDLDVPKLYRNILYDKPVTTRYPIPWDDDESVCSFGPRLN